MTEAVDAGLAPASEAALSTDTAVDTGAAAPAVEATAIEPPKVDLDKELRSVWDKNNPKRDIATGKYAPRAPAAEAATDPAAAEGAATETTESTDQPAGKVVEQPKVAAIDSPLSWSGEMKAKWATVPPEVQAYVAKRETEAHQAITRAGQEIKAYAPVRQLLEQNGDTFKQYGISQEEGLSRLLGMENWLRADGPAAIKELAKAYNVDLSRLAPQSTAEAATTDQGTADPRVSTLAQDLASAQAELRKVTSYLTAQQRRDHEAEQARVSDANAALARQIAEFANDTKHPHFESVRKQMGALMSADENLSLEDAYEQATYAIPDIRQRILSDQRKADEDKQAKERQRLASEARRAGSVNVKSQTGAGQAPKSMDDTLREIAARRFA